MKNDIGSLILAAKKAAVPIVAIETVDPAQTIRATAKGIVNGKADEAPMFIQWDCNLGLRPFGTGDPANKAQQVIEAMADGMDPAMAFGDPAAMLSACLKLPPKTVIYMHNAHRVLSEHNVAQGIWNLRDKFKTTKSMLIMLGPGFDIPLQLQQDIVILDEDLPTREEIRSICDNILKAANKALKKKERPQFELNEKQKEKIADTLIGLSAFASEQQFAMCLEPNTEPPSVDMDQLWRRKQKQVSMTPGLSIERPPLTFNDIRGCSQIIKFGGQIMEGELPPTCIWLFDEIEKGMAGVKGDTSGTSQDQLGVLLTIMQDWGITGWIEIGPPGAAKTYFPQCLAGHYGIPFGKVDLGAMKGSLVGQSEAQIRQAMKVANAISDGRGLFVATCNSITSLPPELRRRFTLGTWFFGLPSTEQLLMILELYITKMQLKKDQCDLMPDKVSGWTGAEIKACCDISRRTGIKLSEAAEYIVPVSVAAQDTIENLYNLANNRFLNADAPGVWKRPVKAAVPVDREIDL